MYIIYLFDQYQVEYDYNNEGFTNDNTPTLANTPVSSANFTTLLNDLTNETVWVDDLAFTEEVDTQAYVWSQGG